LENGGKARLRLISFGTSREVVKITNPFYEPGLRGLKAAEHVELRQGPVHWIGIWRRNGESARKLQATRSLDFSSTPSLQDALFIVCTSRPFTASGRIDHQRHRFPEQSMLPPGLSWRIRRLARCCQLSLIRRRRSTAWKPIHKISNLYNTKSYYE
jgi:hypothetical protein